MHIGMEDQNSSALFPQRKNSSTHTGVEDQNSSALFPQRKNCSTHIGVEDQNSSALFPQRKNSSTHIGVEHHNSSALLPQRKKNHPCIPAWRTKTPPAYFLNENKTLPCISTPAWRIKLIFAQCCHDITFCRRKAFPPNTFVAG